MSNITATEILITNPVSSILGAVKNYIVSVDYGLERTYTLSKSNKILGILRDHPAANEDLRRIDHIALLDLYPQHEYIFGPYKDANAHEFNLVYILYSNRAHQDNELKVLYAGRVLLESLGKTLFGLDPRVLDTQSYIQAVSVMPETFNRKSVNCYYRDYTFSNEEIARLKQIYSCRSIAQPRYNPGRENYIVGMSGSEIGSANPFRLIYELHYEKARLSEHKEVSPANGKKADVRIDNVVCYDRDAEGKEKRRVAFEEFGLDTYALEKITASKGFDRFRGIYIHDGPKEPPSQRGRRYVKLVKNGTDKPISPYLSNCLMMVKLGRLLTDNETVDHIDHNHSNDTIDNLRVLYRATHTSEDSVKLEIAPCACRSCGVMFTMGKKAHEYYRLNPYAPTCSPECKKKVGKGAPVGELITHRYYVTDKSTGKPLYFQSLDYDECRQILYKQGRVALNAT